jgi:hypothetical protein
MSNLIIASSATASNALAVNFAAVSFFHSVTNRGSLIEYINGESSFVDQSTDDLNRLFPTAVRLDECHSMRDIGGQPITVYVNPAAVINVLAFTTATQGCNVQLLGRKPDGGLKIHLPFLSVIAKF